MTHPMHHRIITQSLAGIAATLTLLAGPICARAAISGGPKYTNAVAAEESRDTQFFEAEQSYQEKLKVGRERYDQKQIKRAQIIATMSAELQARQQTVVIEPVAAPAGNTEEPVSWFQPSTAVVVLVAGCIGLGFFLNRPKRKPPVPWPTDTTPLINYIPAPRPGGKTRAISYTLD
jgi:hypothetical protein